MGIISAVCGHRDYIISDRENHASIYDGCRLSFAKHLRFRHSDMDDLERVLASIPYDAGKLIVTDGVFSMSGDICRLPDIVELKKKYNARVMVDDAHGLGVLGEGGRGTASPSTWKTKWTSSWAPFPSPWPAWAGKDGRLPHGGGIRAPQIAPLYLLGLHSPPAAPPQPRPWKSCATSPNGWKGWPSCPNMKKPCGTGR